MSQFATVFDAATGAHLYGTGYRGEAPEVGDGQVWIAGDWPGDEWRLDLATGTPAPLREFALTVSLNSLSGIPAGAVAHIAGERHVIDDGVLEFDPELGLPSSVHVALYAPTYRPWAGDVPCG